MSRCVANFAGFKGISMNDLSMWEQIALIVVGASVVFLFGPATKRALETSRQTEEKDWAGALIPIGLVILFVIFLIMMT